MSLRVRFAPSPTGHLHVGNARTALFNWLVARGGGGSFVLRIEDTDAERSTLASEETIHEDLRWLGIDWDEGPSCGGAYGPYRQSERGALHRQAARDLLSRGAAYHCFCSPAQLAAERETQRAAGLPPRYTGRCRAIPAGDAERRGATEPHVLRFHAAAERVVFEDLVRGRVEFPGAQIGDPVILRADGTATYNFAVVVDDAAMRITHVIRGEDHLSNTPRQILIYRALGCAPPVFAHLSMVLGPDGSPLSKRHGASSLADFRQRGFLPEAMRNYLVLLGWSHPEGKEILDTREIIERFDLARVGHAAAIFDMRKLAWLNAHSLRTMEPARLAGLCRERLSQAGYLPPGPAGDAVERWVGTALATFAGQMETLADAVPATRTLFRFEDHLQDPRAAASLERLAGEPGAVRIAAVFSEVVSSRVPPLLTSREAFREAAAEVGRRLGVRGRPLFHSIRVAVAAADEGPELDRLVPLIDEGSRLSLPAAILTCAARAGTVAARLSGRV